MHIKNAALIWEHHNMAKYIHKYTWLNIFISTQYSYSSCMEVLKVIL